jgi:malic enzyme
MLISPPPPAPFSLPPPQVFLFHGAGSANLGAAALLRDEAGVPASSIYITNSRGVVWYHPTDKTKGNFRNGEQVRATIAMGKCVRG